MPEKRKSQVLHGPAIPSPHHIYGQSRAVDYGRGDTEQFGDSFNYRNRKLNQIEETEFESSLEMVPTAQKKLETKDLVWIVEPTRPRGYYPLSRVNKIYPLCRN